MKRTISRQALVIAVLMGLLITSAVAAQASGTRAGRAKAGTVTVAAHPAGPRHVVVSGRIAKRIGAVVVQRRTTNSRWVRIATARARAHHFSARLTQGARNAHYRVVSGRAISPTVKVVLPKPKPVTKPAPTPAPTPTPPTTSDACGTTLLKADGSPWTCTFDDEFDGTTLDRTKWLPQTQFVTGSPTSYACYFDSPDNVSVSDGNLHLTVRKNPAPLACPLRAAGSTPYSAGSVTTYHLFSQQYGRFEARMKVSAASTSGLHEAFWLWPDDRVASTTAGEIDIAEQYSSLPDLVIPFLHYGSKPQSPVNGVNTAWNCQAKRGVYNTYTAVWDASSITTYVNGKVCLVNRSGDPAFRKPYIINLTQLLGTATNPLTASTPLPATTTVDWVRVWK